MFVPILRNVGRNSVTYAVRDYTPKTKHNDSLMDLRQDYNGYSYLGDIMPRFGTRSKKNLATCDKRIQKVLNEVIKHVDCSVIEGHRSAERQDKLFEEGKTKVKYPNGRHNSNPSRAVDVVPYPIDWDDRERFHLFAGFVIGIAKSMEINLRWGGDWDQDWYVHDNRFDDFPHFELKDK